MDKRSLRVRNCVGELTLCLKYWHHHGCVSLVIILYEKDKADTHRMNCYIAIHISCFINFTHCLHVTLTYIVVACVLLINELLVTVLFIGPCGHTVFHKTIMCLCTVYPRKGCYFRVNVYRHFWCHFCDWNTMCVLIVVMFANSAQLLSKT